MSMKLMMLRLFPTEIVRGLPKTQMVLIKPKKQKVDADADDDDDIVICEAEENGKPKATDSPAKKKSPPPAEDGVICIE